MGGWFWPRAQDCPSGLRKACEDGLSFKSCQGEKICVLESDIMVLCGLPPPPQITAISWCWKKLLLNVYSNHLFWNTSIWWKSKAGSSCFCHLHAYLIPQEWEQRVTSSATFKNVQGRDFPHGAVDKNPPTSVEDTGSIPGPGRSHMPWSN